MKQHQDKGLFIFLYNLIPFLLLWVVFFMFTLPVDAQSLPERDSCTQKDLPDIINSWKKKSKPPKPEKSGSLLLIPTITSNPATGVAIGVGGQYAFREKKPGSLYSSVNGSATYTTKNQFMFSVKNNIFLKDDKVFLSGDWRILLFSQSTYGLGTSSPEGGALDYQYSINGWET